MMVDLESRRLVDMIESREQDDVAAWLKTYPNIKIVSRDGSRIYANAIAEAHPNATQISDRFHLVKNLTDYAKLALQKIFQGRVAIPVTDETKRRRMVMLYGTVAEQVALVKGLRKNGHTKVEISQITGATERTVKKLLNTKDDTKDADIPTPKHTARGLLHIEAVQKVQNRANAVRVLKSEGLGIRQISRETGFTPETIRNYLSDDFTPINAHYGKQREGKLAPFRKEVLQLKSEGLKYREIHDIIKQKGYIGTQDAIRGFISKERRIYRDLSAIEENKAAQTAEPTNGNRFDHQAQAQAQAQAQEFIDKKWLIRLLYTPISKARGITTEQLEYVLSTYPIYKSILEISSEFRTILKSKNPENLFAWMDAAAFLEIPELNSFIAGLKLDIEAVKNAIIYDHSNGIAEGTINKIKVIKRVMYGRCQFQLLRSKCLMLSRVN